MIAKNLLVTTIVSILLIISTLPNYTQPKPTKYELSTTLPIDPTVTVGKLKNGITYYIKVNKKPEMRAELRLAVNAGSVLENDDQQGLAHLCEHMAFNGTKNFKKQELVNYLESIGMRFGPDLNAYTSFDATVYMLSIPTDNESIMKTAFQILEDWAHNISFDPDEIDKERGVVIEEWRLGRGAEARIRDKQFPIIYKGSRYAERLPIGKKEILETFKHETLIKFYKDWYRPDLMAVIAVGDFDKKKIEKFIKTHFSKLIAPKKVPERQTFPVPDHFEPLVSIATDPEATISRVSIYYKHDRQKTKNISDYRKDLIKSLFKGMLNKRLSELTKQADPPYLTASFSIGRLAPSKDTYTLTATVKDNGIERGMETLLIEAERAKKFGFTTSELEREKSEYLRNIEQAYNERDKTESRTLIRQYISHFLDEEPIPGIEFQFNMDKNLLPDISIEEVNRLATELIIEKNRVVTVSAPEKSELTIPTEKDLLKIFENITGKNITPYDDKVTDQPLVNTLPKPGTIVQEFKIKELGITEWNLSYGVRVELKPTDFKNDQILLSAYSPGGHSLVDDKDYISGSTAAFIIQESGIAEFDQITLQKMLQGKIINLIPNIGELEEGFSGSTTPQDFETILQLIYQYFNSPRLDTIAFLSYKERTKGFLHNRSARPESAFEDTLQVILSQYHPRRKPLTVSQLEEIDLHKVYNIFKNRFADASDFTFIIVGAFNIEEIRPLILTYLGGLTSTNRNENWRNIGVNSPKGVISKSVKKGIEQKSQVRIVFTGPFDWSRENRHAFQSMVSVLRIKLREAIREEKGGTYGVGVMAFTNQFPKPEYRIMITWGCAPERVQELIQTAMEQIDSLKTYPITNIYITKIKESQRRENEVNLKDNRFWLSSLQFAYSNFEDPMNILKHDELIEKVTPELIQQAANKYFDMSNYVKVILYPENY